MKVPTPPPQCRSPPSAVSLVLNSVSTRATRITLNAFHAKSGCVHALVEHSHQHMRGGCVSVKTDGGGGQCSRFGACIRNAANPPPTPTPNTLLTHTPRLNRAGLRPHSSCRSGRGRRQGTRDRHPANDEQCTTTKGKIGTLLRYMYVSVVFLRL